MRAHARERQHRHTVLVIDDSEPVRRALATFLSRSGDCRVATAGSGEEALAILYDGLMPCVIVMDLMMFHGHAPQFRAALCAEPRLSAVPLVVLSCADEMPSVMQTLHARAWRVKPPDLHELLALITDLCERPPPAQAAGEGTVARDVRP